MTLIEYMAEHVLSADEMSARIGSVSVSGFRKWASGERQPDADGVERIERVTKGAVTAIDMHRTRLTWLRSNRPDKFRDNAVEAAA